MSRGGWLTENPFTIEKVRPRRLSLQAPSEERRIHGDSPRLKQPFWDVAAVSVALAPGAQFGRRHESLAREFQLTNPHFELSSDVGPELSRPRFAPIRVAAFGGHGWEANGFATVTR